MAILPPVAKPSLPESHASINISSALQPRRRLLSFVGPGFLIAVGYMDPGNWATDLATGSRYGYALLFVVMISNLMAILLQSLALKLGIATERDLAQMCREHYSRPVSLFLWAGAEIAIAACDLAEVIGSAIALQLLFGIPLIAGIIITSIDVLLILLLQHRGFRYLEALVMVLIGTIALLFGIEVALSRPEWALLLASFVVPPRTLFTDPDMLYIAITILGATVMPHNLYLHSSIVQTRRYERSAEAGSSPGPARPASPRDGLPSLPAAPAPARSASSPHGAAGTLHAAPSAPPGHPCPPSRSPSPSPNLRTKPRFPKVPHGTLAPLSD